MNARVPAPRVRRVRTGGLDRARDAPQNEREAALVEVRPQRTGLLAAVEYLQDQPVPFALSASISVASSIERARSYL
ncbi:hypothetical protein [Actinophytocola sp.]|jgi:hypothetical protein|uniref:hypothetical protein n=1 Tax=Actinophytocola sp. TaxID=1872138 RepID=UPI002EDAD674